MPSFLSSLRHAALAGAVLAACRGDANRPAASATTLAAAATCAAPVLHAAARAIVTPPTSAPWTVSAEEER